MERRLLWRSKNPLKTRILFLLGATLMLIFAFCFVAVNRMDQVNQVSAESARTFPLLIQLSSINSNLAALRQAKHANIANPAHANQAAIIALERAIRVSASRIDSMQMGCAEWQKAEQSLLAYLDASSFAKRLSKDTLTRKSYNNSFRLYTTAVEDINLLSKQFQHQLLAQVHKGESQHSRARTFVFIGGLALALFFSLLGAYVSRKVYNHLKEISRSEAKFRAILESSSDANFFLDLNHHVLSFNKAALTKINAISHEKLKLGDDFLRFLPLEKRGEFLGCFRMAAGGREQVQEHSVIIEGEQRWFRRYYYPVRNEEGSIVGVAINSENVTEQKIANEKIKRQVDTLTEISHLQSHKVRGPIATILGLNSLFNHANPSDEFNGKLVKEIDAKVKELDLVVREIVTKTYVS
jgi:PAS domain S-box-containing protein